MRILTALLIIGFIVSCEGSNIGEKEISQEDIIATIGPDKITRDDLDNELGKLSSKQQSLYKSSPEKLNDFLQTYINEKVLYNEALKRGVEKRVDIQEEIQRYQIQLITKTFGREILEELDANSDEIKKYYEQNKKDFEQIQISKIFIRIDPEENNPAQAARSRAELVSSKAIGSESFEELALKYSDDPVSRKRGGKVGYIKRGYFPQELDSKIFKLQEGEITKPFAVDDGYLIIKANNKPEYPPYAQVERTIRSQLINQRLLDYINGLRQEWEVRVYKDRLQEITTSEPKEK